MQTIPPRPIRQWIRSLAALGCLGLAAASGSVKELALVKDINTRQSGAGFVSGGVLVNGAYLFVGRDDAHGVQLWRTDGTEAGTWMVKAVAERASPPESGGGIIGIGVPEITSDDLSVLGVIGSKAVLRVPRRTASGFLAAELWCSDGTDAGTVSLCSAPWGKDFQALESGGLLYLMFSSYSRFGFGNRTLTLVRTDGTALGTTVLVTHTLETQAGFGLSAFVPAENQVFWMLGYGTLTENGTFALWRSDGTISGTVLVKNLFSAGGPSAFSSFSTMRVLGDRLLFSFSNSATGDKAKLWVSDGSESGTGVLTDLNPGADDAPLPLVASGGTLYFSAQTAASGQELWKTDGTAAGTVQVADINPGTASSSPKGGAIAAGGKVFFTADDGSHGTELWRTDGTNSGTVMVADLSPGTASTYFTSSTDPLLIPLLWGGSPPVAAEPVLFSAIPSGGQTTLFASDGTPAGTVPLAANAGFSEIPQHGRSSTGQRYFVVSRPDSGDRLGDKEWWVTDGSPAGTRMVSEVFEPGSVGNSNAFTAGQPYKTHLAPLPGGEMLLSISDYAHGLELWTSNGTPAGTSLIKDIHTATDSADLGILGTLHGKLMLLANDGAHGYELWASDGTAEGTTLLHDINPGSANGYGYSFVFWQGALYFSGFDGTHHSLWKSDGTVTGTQPVALPENVYPLSLVDGGSLLYVMTDKLRVSDGTSAGTVVLNEVDPLGSDYSTVVNGILYFFANDGVHGAELWRSDGTPQGTVLVKDIYPGGYGSALADPAFSPLPGPGNRFYFTAHDGTHGQELWKSDGTEAGTALVKDIAPGSNSLFSASSGLMNPVHFPGRLLFQTVMGGSGMPYAYVYGYGPVWETDGSEAGTIPTGAPPVGVTFNNYLGSIGDVPILSGYETDHACEVWRASSGGADASLLLDLSPELNLSDSRPNLKGLGSVGNLVIFSSISRDSFSSPPELLGLWATDGTAGGTVRLAPESGMTTLLPAAGGGYLGGAGLWFTDGTPPGTLRIADHDSDGSVPAIHRLASLNGQVLMTSDTSLRGTELYRLNTPPAISPMATVATSPWNQSIPLPFGQLLAACGGTDADGDDLSFRIMNVSGGTLTINGQPVVPGQTGIHSGDVVVFTPAANSHGLLTPFSIRAFDGRSHSSATVPVPLQVNAPQDEWRASRFSAEELQNPGVSGSGADPNHNGLANAFEYAFGLDPKASDSSSPVSPDAQIDGSDHHIHPSLHFQRADPFPVDITLFVEESTDLDHWVAISAFHSAGGWSGGGATVQEGPAVNGQVPVHVRSESTVGEGQGPRFLQLRVGAGE